jgi:hypothetical protein
VSAVRSIDKAPKLSSLPAGTGYGKAAQMISNQIEVVMRNLADLTKVFFLVFALVALAFECADAGNVYVQEGEGSLEAMFDLDKSEQLSLAIRACERNGNKLNFGVGLYVSDKKRVSSELEKLRHLEFNTEASLSLCINNTCQKRTWEISALDGGLSAVVSIDQKHDPIRVLRVVVPDERKRYEYRGDVDSILERICARNAVELLSFGDYPASGVYRGTIKFPDFRGRDKADAIYRTRITEAMREGPNFAGKYTLIQIGCGTGCRFYPIGDVETGHTMPFPLGGEDYGHLDLYFRLESALVLAVWDNYGETCFQEAFKMNKGSLRSLGRSSTPRGGSSACCPQMKESPVDNCH